MGYFSNGTANEIYQEQYCVRCVHFDDGGCPVMFAHMMYNYRDCNDEESILHLLIPRDGIENKQCTMFIPEEKETHHDKA